jgi:tetratricopeptide (TPR) repeat protein
MSDGGDPATGDADCPEGSVAELLARELAAAWARARAAGAEARELVAVLRERLAKVRALPTAHDPARAERGPENATRGFVRAQSCPPRMPRVEDSDMTADQFIGREDELSRLSAVLDQARARHPATVFLAGDPGIGKTRLLDEFTARAALDGDGVFVLRGECVDLREAVVPYGPLIAALRGFARRDGEQARRLAGPAGWDRLGGLTADFTFTDQPDGLRRNASPPTAAVVYGAVLSVLRVLGAKKPVLLIFENIHWADQSTLDLISYVSKNWDDERALLICSHRSALVPGHPLRARLDEPNLSQVVEHLALEPFGEDELRAFLNLGREADGDLLRLAFRLSQGNPFFIKELLRSGALDGGDAAVPASLQDLLLGQLSRLSDSARGLLDIAAIAARRVDLDLLAAVSPLGEQELERALRECLDHRMLVPDEANDAYYVFRHALLREAVYKNVLRATRVRRHAAMAEAIAANTALSLDEDVSSAVELAHHWFQAGRKPQALVAALRAGAMTARLHAFPEAEAHYRRALELWDEVPEPCRVAGATRERVLVEAADTARWAGHVADAVGFVRTAIDELDDGAGPRRRGRLHERLGSYLWEAGDAEGSLEAYAVARRELALEPPADAIDVVVLAGLAGAHSRAGRHTEALGLARQGAELAREVGAVTARGRALNAAGIAATMLGRAEQGVRDLRESLRIARESDQLEDQFRAYGNLGFALEHAGDPRQAADVALEGLEQARRHGLAYARQAGVLANNASMTLRQLGEWDRAVELLDAALRDRPPVRQSAYLRLNRAELHVARGAFDAADRLLAQIADQRLTDPRFVGALRCCEAELALWRDRPAVALAKVSGALDEVGVGENGPEEVRICALGLRAVADLRRGGTADPEVVAQGAALAERAARRAEQGPSLPDVPALRLQCAAEHDRAGGGDSSETWGGVAAAWEELRQPYPAAYARWRQAAALRREGDVDGMARVTREAVESLAGVGARPLEAALAAETGVPAPRPAVFENPLTPQQTGVARLVAAGLRNADIAQELGIAEGTVARHVFDAGATLRQHGYTVRGRVQLANFAREHGLLEGEANPG